jgi:hypothetical protein
MAKVSSVVPSHLAPKERMLHEVVGVDAIEMWRSRRRRRRRRGGRVAIIDRLIERWTLQDITVTCACCAYTTTSLSLLP